MLGMGMQDLGDFLGIRGLWNLANADKYNPNLTEKLRESVYGYDPLNYPEMRRYEATHPTYGVGDVTAYYNPTKTQPIVIMPSSGRADRDQQGSVTTITNIYQTKDPAASLASQMPGGGISDIPIFNWGY
jgi:hypothetical protein